VVHQANTGLSGARNAGLHKAQGEFVLFVDSDDILSLHLVEKCVKALLQTKTDIAIFDFDAIDENGAVVKSSSHKGNFPDSGVYTGRTSVRFLLNEYGKKPFLSNYTWMFICKKSVYTENCIEFPNLPLLEDLASTYKIFAASKKTVLIADTLYHYRQRNQSLLHSKKTIETFNVGLPIFEKRAEQIQKKFPDLYSRAKDNISRWLVIILWESLAEAKATGETRSSSIVFRGLIHKTTPKTFLRLPIKYKLKFVLSSLSLLMLNILNVRKSR
jgi:glycosyltransferase involved in cell wall biosynthesis